MSDPAKVVLLDSIKLHAFSDMAVQEPDWNVVGTEALERQVQQYRYSVDSVIAKFQSVTTQPLPTKK